MTDNSTYAESPDQSLDQIIQSARKLGVEIDEEEAIQWLTAVASGGDADDLEVDQQTGVFAHRVVMLDFDPADLERVRRVAAIVEIPDRAGVETAIALSGSSAQSQVQTFPGDFDYFERVNIKAETREAAVSLLADVLRDKALASAAGPGYQLIEVRFGSYQQQVIRNGEKQDKGYSIKWSLAEIRDGEFQALNSAGETISISWESAAEEPGWCKLDWVLVDPARPRAVKASNMLDVTWEDPEGNIHPLDGFIDPYYQEVYLDAESIPLFSKISKQMDPGALQHYIRQLEGEVRKYTASAHANYGKVAKRLYNIFRLTGKFGEAAFIRELFDEPAALLYQVAALLDGLADLGSDEKSIDHEILIAQIDDLIEDVMTVSEGQLETDLVLSFIRLRDDLTGRRDLGSGWESLLFEMQGKIEALVNETFQEKLLGIPGVADYLDTLG